MFALVDESGPEPESRTFHQKIDNVTVIVGGGINDLARSGVEVTAWPCEVRSKIRYFIFMYHLE